jgi:preprotein translocase subunit SecA
VDEVDSILIDEARTPLIISGEPEQAAETYYAFARAIKNLEPGEDYEVDEKFHTASPTESGVDKIEKTLGVDNLYAPENGQLVNHLIQAINAKELYKRDDEYVVIDGAVKIVDEFTAASWRTADGRRAAPGGGGQEASASRREAVATVTIRTTSDVREAGQHDQRGSHQEAEFRIPGSRWYRSPPTSRSGRDGTTSSTDR